jgi:serine protease Do
VKVDAASDAAARAGLREGDIILAVGNSDISNAREFESAIGKADKSKALSVLFRRGDWAQYALIRPAR